MRRPALWMIPILGLPLILGCESSDSRLVTMAERHAAEQAQQSQQLTAVHHELATAGQRLIEADAQARQELVAMQHALRQDQAQVDRQRDLLETERKQLAAARYRDPLVAAAILNCGLLLAGLLPLALAGYVLWIGRPSPGTDETVLELLVEELTSAQPRLRAEPARSALPEPAARPSADGADEGRANLGGD